MLNVCTLMGRFVYTPEIHETTNNVKYTNFTLAVERDIKRDGKDVDFIECQAWRDTAEFVTKYFKKGDLIAVTGRLQIRDWEDKQGNKRKTAEVVVNHAYFGGKKETKQADFNDIFEDDDIGELPF